MHHVLHASAPCDSPTCPPLHPALLIMFFLEHFDMLSGGALGSLCVGLVTCYMWERGAPRAASMGPSDTYAPDIERVMAKVGVEVAVPIYVA
jgi:hypothetical protein